MCGILGIFKRHESVDAESLRSSIETLYHRGPDGRKTWISPSRQVGLAHARLSIIDLVTGDQPLSNEDGSIHAVVNGELYGFQEIRTELEKEGHIFKTKSDSEILIHLYEEMGAQCVHRLRGEFAFILWDEKQKRLFAARDRFGIKPLYYSFKGQDLYLASEVKAIAAAGVPLHWDHESYHHTNLMGAPAQDRTLFQGVYQIPPGHMILTSFGNFRLLKYWDFDYPTSAEIAKDLRSPQDRIEEFRCVLDEAVKLRLHADVPVACYLSGGLDSCSVLGLAARHTSGPVQAFTLGFDHGAYDETNIAKNMAAQAGAEFHSIPISHDDLADHFEDAVWNSEAFFLNAHGVAKFLLSEAVRDAGFKVVLTGEGSDEILAGYPHFRRDRILYQSEDLSPELRAQLMTELQAANRVCAGMLMPHGEGAVPAILEKTIGHYPSWILAQGTGALRYAQLYSEDYAAETANYAVYQSLTDSLDIPNQISGRDPIAKSMYLWSKVWLPNYILNVVGDRMEMAHSIEGRVPFLDHHVVDVAKRLPSNLKIFGMTEKYALREAAKDVITAEVHRRQKHPFLSPPATLKKNGRLFQFLSDTIASSSFRDQPFFDQSKVQAFLADVSNGDEGSHAANDVVLTGILSTALLQRRFSLG